MILSGRVEVEGRRVDKAGTAVDASAAVQVLGPPTPVRSAAAASASPRPSMRSTRPEGLTCLDVGASTGGFTDCLLQRGARIVYAIDVGYGQLDAKLRADPRVVVRERVNARNLSAEHVPEPVSLAVLDLSFISVRLVLGSVLPARAGRSGCHLAKPQFEAGRARSRPARRLISRDAAPVVRGDRTVRRRCRDDHGAVSHQGARATRVPRSFRKLSSLSS